MFQDKQTFSMGKGDQILKNEKAVIDDSKDIQQSLIKIVVQESQEQAAGTEPDLSLDVNKLLAESNLETRELSLEPTLLHNVQIEDSEATQDVGIEELQQEVADTDLNKALQVTSLLPKFSPTEPNKNIMHGMNFAA